MIATGAVLYLMPDLLGALLVGLGAAALFVSEETYRKRRREVLSFLGQMGLRGWRSGGGDGPA